ncbi:MAG: hypothetical protein Q7V05_06710 [Methanoregula sp.]|nr:hypothetical protein [Methanoregula sp.]MDP2796236.1 hypothetical protein [Methanoregula sp.]
MIFRSVMPVLVAISLILLLVIPAGAVSIRHIDVTVAENGDALIAADYSLNWAEQAIAYPAAVPLLSGALGKNVRVHTVSSGNTQLTIQHLVKVGQNPGTITYKTPAFSISDARTELDKYWFGNLITLDGTSGYLTIRFPDGEIVEYRDLNAVPSFEHAVPHL